MYLFYSIFPLPESLEDRIFWHFGIPCGKY